MGSQLSGEGHGITLFCNCEQSGLTCPGRQHMPLKQLSQDGVVAQAHDPRSRETKAKEFLDQRHHSGPSNYKYMCICMMGVHVGVFWKCVYDGYMSECVYMRA